MPAVTSSSRAPTAEPRLGAPAPPPQRARAAGLSRAVGLAVVSGVALWAAQEPLGWAPLGFVALVPALLVASDGPRGALVGAVAGFTYFGLLLNWVLVFGWFAWLPLVAALAVEMVALCWLAGRALRAGWPLWQRLLVLPSVLVVLEWVRDRWPLGGFTWGELGASQAPAGFTRAAAAVGGVALLTWLVAAVNVVAAAAVERIRTRSGALWAPAGVVAAIAVVFAAAWLGRPAAPPSGSLAVEVVQANTFEGSRVATDDMIAAHLGATADLVGAAHDAGRLDLIVWGESSLLTADPTQALAARVVAVSTGVPVLANASVLSPDTPTFENTTVLFTADGVADRYVKRHLVPFGERVPLRDLLGFIGSLQQVPRDAVGGSEPGIFEVDGTTLGTITCFETVFPDPARELVDLGARALVFTTNNASFRRSAEPDQYLALTRLRATETHRAITLTAVSGKSATIDPDGAIHDTTGLFTRETLRWDMPLQDDRTLFTRLGHWAAWASVVALVLGAALPVLARRRGLGRSRGGEVQ